MYNYILFDLDGTVSDTGEGIYNGVKYALEKYGITENYETTLNGFFTSACGFVYEVLLLFTRKGLAGS